MNKVITSLILILLTNITVYSSFEFESELATELCEKMTLELIEDSSITIGTEEDLERLSKAVRSGCREETSFSFNLELKNDEKNEITLVDNQCIDNCAKTHN